MSFHQIVFLELPFKFGGDVAVLVPEGDLEPDGPRAETGFEPHAASLGCGRGRDGQERSRVVVLLLGCLRSVRRIENVDGPERSAGDALAERSESLVERVAIPVPRHHFAEDVVARAVLAKDDEPFGGCKYLERGPAPQLRNRADRVVDRSVLLAFLGTGQFLQIRGVELFLGADDERSAGLAPALDHVVRECGGFEPERLRQGFDHLLEAEFLVRGFDHLNELGVLVHVPDVQPDRMSRIFRQVVHHLVRRGLAAEEPDQQTDDQREEQHRADDDEDERLLVGLLHLRFALFGCLLEAELGGILGLGRFLLRRFVSGLLFLGLPFAAVVRHLARVRVRSGEDGVALGAFHVRAGIGGFPQTQLGPAIGATEFDGHDLLAPEVSRRGCFLSYRS